MNLYLGSKYQLISNGVDSWNLVYADISPFVTTALATITMEVPYPYVFFDNTTTTIYLPTVSGNGALTQGTKVVLRKTGTSAFSVTVDAGIGSIQDTTTSASTFVMGTGVYSKTFVVRSISSGFATAWLSV